MWLLPGVMLIYSNLKSYGLSRTMATTTKAGRLPIVKNLSNSVTTYSIIIFDILTMCIYT